MQQKKYIVLALVGLLVVGLTTTLGLFHTPEAEAGRVILLSNDLYTVGEAFGKAVTNSKDVMMLFDEHDQMLLIGRGIEMQIPETESTGGTRLHLLKNDGTGSKLLSDKLVVDAFFDHTGTKVYYLTRELSLWVINVEDGTNTLVTKTVINPALSPDAKSIVYMKLNADWEPGDYYEKSLGLAILNLGTGEEIQLTTTTEDFGPQWTPDGSHILFFSLSPGGLASHFVIKNDGTERKQLTNIDEVYVTEKTIAIPGNKPSWSHDGKSLVYESDSAIWVNTFENDFAKIKSAKKIGYGKSPKWLPDGTVSIVATSAKKPEKALIRVDKEGNIIN
jgi:hypothetical protein